ncbi:FG-GAP repeat domain-containing protein [Flectobacillus roseus]|uniref:VCBS repeat-containing protein n=1 Tax=Flectobacillus roseus TaxID=502259 RepID=A0ABT6YED9_9BACT|nr:VCBS repeat-containing protein [Flectobacillus roseus]MDI9861880.1 VCBS repeat-containing protein [Flectobacillus roseus]
MNRASIFSLLIANTLLYVSCDSTKANKQNLVPSGLTGEQLSQQHCVSCHAYPSPNLVEKEWWAKGILPKMALRLGMGNKMGYFTNISYEDMMEVSVANIYPDAPAMAPEDWKKIVDFYVKNAPEKPIPQVSKVKATQLSDLFDIQTLENTNNEPSLVTMVKILPNEQALYVAHRGRNRVEKWDKTLQKISEVPTESPVSDVVKTPNNMMALGMGIMDPNDQALGKLWSIAKGSPQTLVEKLRRPVEISMGDLDANGTPDYLICEFGNDIGKLTWYDQNFKLKKEILNFAGIRNATITDINGDKLPDIVVLQTQGDEGIWVLENRGNGEFEPKRVLRFPPIYGSSFIQVVDINKDGYQDIVYTNGDNADASISLKRYHGVHVYLNDGKTNFKRQYFYPMHGASKALSQDFDGDGDMDIAAISFFPDKKQSPAEGFLYFENTGKGFTPHFMEGISDKKWMVMDCGDLDKDGDIDLVLGAFNLQDRDRQSNASSEKRTGVYVLKSKNKTHL